MRHLYGSAATSTIPAMQARAQVARQHRREDQAGTLKLPGMDEYEIESATVAAGSYGHVPPWPPLAVTDETLDLEGEPDIDPDDIDVADWDDVGHGDAENE